MGGGFLTGLGHRQQNRERSSRLEGILGGSGGGSGGLEPFAEPDKGRMDRGLARSDNGEACPGSARSRPV